MAKSVFDEKSEDELWIEFRKTKSPALRDAFIRQYMPLVKYVVGKISPSMPSSVEFDDLVGFGQFGLLDAINRYDPERNVKFKTYAVTRIRGAIFDELRQQGIDPATVITKYFAILGIVDVGKSVNGVRYSHYMVVQHKDLLGRHATFRGYDLDGCLRPCCRAEHWLIQRQALWSLADQMRCSGLGPNCRITPRTKPRCPLRRVNPCRPPGCPSVG